MRAVIYPSSTKRHARHHSPTSAVVASDGEIHLLNWNIGCGAVDWLVSSPRILAPGRVFQGVRVNQRAVSCSDTALADIGDGTV